MSFPGVASLPGTWPPERRATVAKAGGAGCAATLAAALRYHAMGWSLVPLEPGGGKKPDAALLRQLHGSPSWSRFKGSRATGAEVRAWFEVNPGIGIGVILGASSGGLVVLDVDDEAAFGERGLAIPPTWTVRTGRGWHYYFRADRQQLKVEAGWGHLLGDGQIAALPPSRHVRGGVYRWSAQPGAVELAVLTEDLLGALTSRAPSRAHTQARGPHTPTPSVSPYVSLATPPPDGRPRLEELVADPAAVQACAQVLGLGSQLGDVRCPFHFDLAPSASLNAQGDGIYRLTCQATNCPLGSQRPGRRSLGMGELLASRDAGWKVVHLEGYEVALWSANVMAMARQLSLPQLEVADDVWDLSETHQRVLDGFHKLARIKRWLHGPAATTLWGRDFAARWCGHGLTSRQVRNATEYLEAIGALVVEHQQRQPGRRYAVKHYRPGQEQSV